MDYNNSLDSTESHDDITASTTDTDECFDDSLEMDDTPEVLRPQILEPEVSNIVLPPRFRPKHHNNYTMTYTTIKPQSSFEELTIGVVIRPDIKNDVIDVNNEQTTGTGSSSLSDMTQALSWIRHQLVSLLLQKRHCNDGAKVTA